MDIFFSSLPEPSIPDITADQEVEGEGQNEDGGENAENTEAQAAETSPTAEVVSPETATDDKKKGTINVYNLVFLGIM